MSHLPVTIDLRLKYARPKDLHNTMKVSRGALKSLQFRKDADHGELGVVGNARWTVYVDGQTVF